MAEKKPGPDWRNANKKAAHASPAAGAGKRDWQKQSLPSSGPRKPWSRGSKLTLAVVLLGLFFGGVYIVIPWLRPIGPACFVLMGASYDENLAVPHNAYGWKDLDDLGNLTKETELFSKNGKPKLLHRSPELKGADIWKKEWDILGPKIRNSREKTVVVFLALHGAADSKDAYFFLNDDQSYVRLPFAEALKSLQSDDLRDKNIVFVLEPALARANWSAGVLENNFVAKLPDKAKLKKNIFILCASDVNQVSWPSEEWQQTVFGHYVIEGLRGGAVDGTHTSRVTVRGLFEYVKKKVVVWSQVNRAVEQTPILIGDESLVDDVEIVQVGPSYQERDRDAPGSDFRVPAELERAWTDWQELRTKTPRPAVYSPALWRRYQDLLVRYEQLLRAGDPTKKAGDIAGNLAGMKKKLENEARFDAADPALSLSLAMPEALGVPLPVKGEELKKALQQVWDAVKVEDRPKFFKEAIDVWKAQPEVKSAQMQVQSYRALLDFVTESQLVRDSDFVGPQSEQDKRSKLTAILDQYDANLTAPRPAEVHFATMLVKDICREPAPDFDLLRLSLAVRQLAERTALAVPEKVPPALVPRDESKHPYSEIVYPWNRDRIEKADAIRRPGEDYLFGSNKDDWEKGRRLLKRADSGYREIQKDSLLYRKGLEARDAAYAVLPYYALWVANQRVTNDEGRAGQIRRWGGFVEQLADRAKILHDELDNERGRAPSLVKLADCLAQLDEGLANLMQSMIEEIGDAKSTNDTHDLWFNREAILSVPPLLAEAAGANTVETRMNMLRANRGVSRTLFESTKSHAKVFGAKVKDEAEIAGKRNAAMATAAFKGFWRNAFAKLEGESVVALGEAIGDIVKKWPVEINTSLVQSQKNGDLAQAAQELARADFLSRGLPGGFDDKPEPMSVSKALRSIRMHVLLVAQARRAGLDHWYSEVDGEPYYKKAALGYLNVAKQLVEVKGAEAKDANKMRTGSVNVLIEAVKTVGLEIAGNANDYWTSEKEFPIRWTVKAPNDPYLIDPKAADDANAPPLAVAVTWRELDGPGAWKDGATPGQRRTLELNARRTRDPDEVYYLTKTDNDAALKATYNLLLRGQLASKKIEISQKNPDLIVHDFPKPAQSYIKVRMHPDFTYGSVSIALDISGSMIWKGTYGVGKEPNRKTRLELALTSLRTALEFVPDGTYVSVLAFVTDRGTEVPKIEIVQKPKQWTRNKEALDSLIERIETLAKGAWEEYPKDGRRPWGGTPMAYLLKRCYEKGFPDAAQEVRGPKVILALGDGGDTTTAELLGETWPHPENDEKRYNKKVRDFLIDSLGDKDVEVHFVCFLDPLSDDFAKESRVANAQFGCVEEFKLKGVFVINTKPAELAEQLKKSIRPRLVVLQGNETAKGFPPEGVYVSLPRDEYKLFAIPDGEFLISVKGSRERNMKVAPGDIINIVLKRDPNDYRKVLYEREAFADVILERMQLLGDAPSSLAPFRVAVVANDTLVQNQRKTLAQLIAVEELSKTGIKVQQTIPPFTWIETKPKSQSLPQMMRWYREFGYPALTYRVLGYDWPAPGGVAVPSETSVWLTDKPSSPAFSRPLVRSMKDEKADKVLLDADQYATIEYARIEEKEVVPDGSDNATARPALKQCLVVRVEHAKDRPVMIQFGGAHKGEEHHFFHAANKCTAIFWDLANPDRDDLTFNIIFLDALKKDVTPTTFPLSRRGGTLPVQLRMGI